MLSTSLLHDGSFRDTEVSFEDLDQSTLRLRKHMRQEGEYKKDREILEQKIEILEAQIKDFEKRESVLKRMNDDIIFALKDLNQKGDSALMSKVSEELELANKEKLRGKEQLELKYQTLRNKLHKKNNELKKKLEESEQKRKEVELELEKERTQHKQLMQQEYDKLTALKREWDEERKKPKNNEEVDILRRRCDNLEDENRRARDEYQNEIEKIREAYNQNLLDLKAIHQEERAALEERLKKTKENLFKVEEEHETVVEKEAVLANEVELLKEKMNEMEADFVKEVENVNIEKYESHQKCVELERKLEDIESSFHIDPRVQTRRKSSGVSSSADKGGIERRSSSKSFNPSTLYAEKIMQSSQQGRIQSQGRVNSIASIIEHENPTHSISSTSFILQDICDSDRRKSVPKFNQNTEITKSSWGRGVYLRTPIQTNNDNIDANTHQEGSIVYYGDDDLQRSMNEPQVTDFSEKVEKYYNNDQNVFMEGKMDLRNNESSQVSRMESSNMFGSQRYSGSAGRLGYIVREQPQLRQKSFSQKKSIEYRPIDEEGLNVSYFDGSENGDNGVHESKIPVNYQRRQENEGKYQMSTGRIDSQLNESTFRMNNNPLQLASKLRKVSESQEFGDQVGLWTVNMSQKENINAGSEANGMHFSKGLQEVMNGLSNIKTKLEKQRDDILNVKNQSIQEAQIKSRSLSNVGLAAAVVNIPGKIHRNDNRIASQDRIAGTYYTGNIVNKYMKPERNDRDSFLLKDNSYYGLNNISFDERRSSAVLPMPSYKPKYSQIRTRTPLLSRQVNTGNQRLMHSFERHRNSLV